MMSYEEHRNEAFFRDVTGNALSTAHFLIKINKNFKEYFLNVTLSYTNNRNKYISTASSKKLSKMYSFYNELTIPPPLKGMY